MLTRQQQNAIIVSKITDQLGDQGTVQDKITESFTTWFEALVEQGVQMLAPQTASSADTGGESNGNTGT